MKKGLLIGTAVLGAAAGAYVLGVRPWHRRWGAADDELIEPLPGDEVLPEADDQVTHAITINAPASEVWKWLVQVGQGRGGFFSYDWLENLVGLGIHNVYEIEEELQELKVGDFVRAARQGWLGGKFEGKAGWFVVGLEKDRHLVLRDEIAHGSWVFVLKPVDGQTTRLLIRGRGTWPRTLGMKLFNYGLFEPAHFVMERKMLLTLKELAEHSARSPGLTAPVERSMATAAVQ
jgi:hypothetical protein